MIPNKEIFINGAESGIGNRFRVQVIERRPKHPDFGEVVFETPLASNLILEHGMDAIAVLAVCDIFTVASIGTGNTPTQVSSGTTTATTSGTTCTASAAIFSSSSVGQLIYFPSTAQPAKITAYTNATTVTLSVALTISSGLSFTIYAINQLHLDSSVHASAVYNTESKGCGTTYSNGIYIHKRTYVFPVETGDQAYSEVGFSSLTSMGAVLHMRGIIASAPVSVSAGQQVNLIYYVMVAVTPITPRDRTVVISGWPSADGNEQLAGNQFSYILPNGNTSYFPLGEVDYAIGDPGASKSMAISEDSTPLAAYDSPQGIAAIPVGGQQVLTPAVYTIGSYIMLWSAVYSAGMGNSSSIYKLMTIGARSGNPGLIYLFDAPQTKDDLHTLTVVWKFTWARIFDV